MFWDKRAKTVLWSAAVLTATAFGALHYLENRPEPAPTAQRQHPSEGGCLDLDVGTFCHELTHVRTTATHVIGDWFQTAETNLGFNLESRRTCTFDDQSYEVTNKVVVGTAIAEMLGFDYPELVSDLVSQLQHDLEHYNPIITMLYINNLDRTHIDAQSIENVFGITGTLLLKDTYFEFDRYYSIEESAEACRAYAASQQN